MKKVKVHLLNYFFQLTLVFIFVEEYIEEDVLIDEPSINNSLEEDYDDEPSVFETIIVKQSSTTRSKKPKIAYPKVIIDFDDKSQDEMDTFESNKSSKKFFKYLCNQCNQSFKSTISLDQHLFYQHGETDCKNCQKSFSDLKKLRTHSVAAAIRYLFVEEVIMVCAL